MRRARLEGQPSFDIGVFDEAPKTARREGAKFGFVLEDANLPIAKRVFMTATPRHYDVRKEDPQNMQFPRNLHINPDYSRCAVKGLVSVD